MDNLELGIQAYGDNSFDYAIMYFNKYISEIKSKPITKSTKDNLNIAKDYLQRAKTKYNYAMMLLTPGQ